MKKVKKTKRVLLLVAAFAVHMLLTPFVFAQKASAITLEDIYNPEIRDVYQSDETVFYPENEADLMRASGQYPIYTRVTVSQSSSNGLIERSSRFGTYASVAGIALSFIGGIPAMTVSTILSVVGIAASSSTYVQAKTFTSYVQFVKKGEARWSNVSSYTAFVFSGKRNHYKHVLGGKKNSSGQWTTYTHDYLSSPAYVQKGSYYDRSDSWFKEQAKQRLLSGGTLDDMPW